MKTHVIYSVIILCLLALIGSQSIHSIWEKKAHIMSRDNKYKYTLRMLSSGDLIFEKNRFLPLASYRDYWGDMSVTKVEWAEDQRVSIAMSDGTELRIILGVIEVISPNPPLQSTR